MANYVDNKQLYAVILEYKAEVQEAKQSGAGKPQIPNYVGECILLIAQRLATKPNFINYSYRDEMISDGIENCISYFDNFDPAKSDNPFAYFTQIIWFAFLRRIEKEKKHLYIKQKTLENFYFEGMLAEQGIGEDDRNVTVNLDNDYMTNLVVSFDKKQAEKQKKSKEKRLGLEKFIDESE